jgi:uncharacterized membrane protein (DUF485 family)
MVIFILKCLGSALLLLLAIAFGRHVGLRLKRNKSKDEKMTLGSSVGAILLLMSFMLAITYSLVATRFSERKQLILDDVNSIGTVYLRTDLLSPAGRSQSQSLLREYVDLRVLENNNAPRIESLQARANRWEEIQRNLWNLALRDQQLGSDSSARRLYIDALNKMIDVHTTRFNTEFVLRLQPAVWLLLATVTTISMIALGVELGLSEIHSRAGVIVVALLTFMLSTLLLFLHETDKPESHVITISQQPMIHFYQTILPKKRNDSVGESQ